MQILEEASFISRGANQYGEGTRGVRVTVVGNGHVDTSSNL